MRRTLESIDYTSRDYQAYKDLLITKLQEYMPEYTDISETDAGIVILEAFANGLDICSYYSDAIANDVILATTQDRQLATLMARDLGYTPYSQTASVIPMVFTLEVEQEEDVIISRGSIVTTEETDDVEPIMFETLEDLVIPAGKLGNEQNSEGNYIYTVLAEQGETLEEDYLGSSDGTRFQTFNTTYTEVLLDSLKVYVNEGDGESVWTRVSSFQDCDENSKVYTVIIDEYDECTIQFGDGIRGKIPSVYDDGIRAEYRVGGGIVGNVQENTVTVMETDIPFVDSCTNLAPVTRGHEKESVDEIRYNAPAFNRTRDRAVTLTDYEDLLLTHIAEHPNFHDILNTKAIRNSLNMLKVDLYYQMEENCTMTEALQKEISDFFSPRTMLGTSYTLIPYVPKVVNLEVSLIVKSNYNQQEVKEDVEEIINSFFAYGNQTFGDEIVSSDLEQEVKDSVEGVRAFRVQTPTTEIIQCDEEYEILTLGTVTITATGGEE